MNEEGKPSGNYWKPRKKNKVGFCGKINVSLREPKGEDKYFIVPLLLSE